ncbi:MAG: transporter substrate-binding domain-containing protein, partial [Lacunisphaera sp.]
NRLGSSIKGLSDLQHSVVATVAHSTAAHYLKENHIQLTAHETLDDALAAVKSGKAEACVYDTAMLKYRLRTDKSLIRLPSRFEESNYAIAVPLNSPLRKKLNIALLQIQQGPYWASLLQEYFGATN